MAIGCLKNGKNRYQWTELFETCQKCCLWRNLVGGGGKYDMFKNNHKEALDNCHLLYVGALICSIC